MRSLLVGTAPDADYCYYPMPFDRSAKLSVLSLKMRHLLSALESQLQLVARERLGQEVEDSDPEQIDRLGAFHAVASQIGEPLRGLIRPAVASPPALC